MAFICDDFNMDGIDEIFWAVVYGETRPDSAIFSMDYSADVHPPVTVPQDPPTDLWFPWNGPVSLYGVAQDDHAGIRQVDASTDQGSTWSLISAYPDWSTEITVPEIEGRFEVWLRATDCSNKLEDPPAVWWGWTGAHSPTPTPSPTPTVTPIPELGVELELSGSYFRPGDEFSLGVRVHNPDGTRYNVPLAVVLEWEGAFWFWPGWEGFDPGTGAGFDFALLELPTGTLPVGLIDPFSWPDLGTTSGSGAWFHGALLTANLGAVMGVTDSVSWGFGP